MLSFSVIVAANNLLALKNFTTFLFNYEIHERPNFLEKRAIRFAKGWIERLAIKQFNDLKAEIKPTTINLGINDCATGLFTVLYLANQQNNVSMAKEVLSSGTEIFMSIAHLELEFEKLKKGNVPQVDSKYGDK